MVLRPHRGPQRRRQKQLSDPCSRSTALMTSCSMPSGCCGAGLLGGGAGCTPEANSVFHDQ